MLGFSGVTTQWFTERFGAPTEAQRLGWPHILAGKSTLIAAPTGSGKTLAAFLASIDELVQLGMANQLPETVHTLYVSPLKALSNDIERNLETPLLELSQTAREMGLDLPRIRAEVRTGDTPASRRQSMLRRPPQILVTTPESLYLLLTSPKARSILQQVRTVIVDEIHALARDKRGSHLALSLERLEQYVGRPLVRVGLSATQRPIDAIARFLVGDRPGGTCEIVDTGHSRDRDLAIELPRTALGAVCSQEQWNEIHDRLIELIESHASTLIFVNTRRLAERLGFQLSQRLGKEQIATHHGSLSKEIRLDAEQRLKSGELKAIVATASLELGIDIGAIDLVCQIGSTRSIANFLQRVGRSGHSLGGVPKGRLFALTRDELIESLALLRSVHRGHLDAVEIPTAPLDILAQQIVATVAAEEWDESDLFDVVRRASPYRDLSREDFEAVLESLSSRGPGSGARLHRDRIHGKLRAPRGTRIIAASCGGAIPDNADFLVVTAGERSVVGTVNEDFAIESMAGDVFLLGNTSWRIVRVGTGEVVVEDAGTASPTIPFWLGEAPGRTIELSHEVSELRKELAERIDPEHPSRLEAARAWLRQETGIDGPAVEQGVDYIATQKASLGIVPTDRQIVFERFFDDMGGMQLVIHAPLGSRINRAWGLALRKRFCRSFDFELQASADDDGIVLSLGPQHSFPLEDLFAFLNPKNARHMLEQAILDAPMFRVRWRWNATRALAVLRHRGGQRVPPALQRFRADDLLTAVFPASTACLENRPHDIELPDHPLIRQTMEDCLFEATDLVRWIEVLDSVGKSEIELLARDTREPSPFAHERLNAYPYAFLDDAPLEERRARAVSYRRSTNVESVGDLTALDSGAIEEVRQQSWPNPRDADEMHETLLGLVVVPADEVSRLAEFGRSSEMMGLLESARRACRFTAARADFWCAVESWPIVRAAYPDATPRVPVALPAHLERTVEEMEARRLIVAGWMDVLGPTSAADLAARLRLTEQQVSGALQLLEAAGDVIRGRFVPGSETEEWCQRRLLARIHRMTLDGLRRRIKPVEVAVYLDLLARHHRLNLGAHDARVPTGPRELMDVVRRLAGFEAPAGSWEFDLFGARLGDYAPIWLDELTLTGQAAWGRLDPPTLAAGVDRKRLAGLNRVVPISIFPREDLSWLLPPLRTSADNQARDETRGVWEILRDRGALFMADLVHLTGLLPAQVEQALAELSALGLVTADGFAGIRSLVKPKGAGASFSRRRRWNGHGRTSFERGGGRWSVFPFHQTAEPASWKDRAEAWAHLLFRRYPILFRDLLARESSAPPWWQLVSILRRWESQGKVQGGRFVAGVAAEQYALPGIVDQLRSGADAKESSEKSIAILSAADPLNLVGIVTEDARIPATHGNSLALVGGRLVATRTTGQIQWLDPECQRSLPEIETLLVLNGEARLRQRKLSRSTLDAGPSAQRR